ncbi:ATP-dependent Clp protease proteolytic subunit [Candidatus Peregrinibacteria bacterium]|nr:ATP-dependent Clp protease proteolytic subunit [Candidatus Peregrinibacteria bacterium]
MFGQQSQQRTLLEYLAPLTVNDGVDAELVVIADTDFRPAPLHRTQLLYREDQGRSFGRRSTEALIKYVALIRRERKEDIDKILFLGKKLQRVWGKRVLETMLEGRLKIALLIDSDGGVMSHLDYFNDALAYWKDGVDTKVEAYVFGHAMSAGFSLMCEADQIAVLPRSEMMWHFSSNSTNQRRKLVNSFRKNLPLPDSNLMEVEKLRRFLYRNSVYKYADFAKRKVREGILADSTGRGEIGFVGANCFKAELANEMFDDVVSMARHFNSRYRIAVDKKVTEFWVLSAINESSVDSLESWRYVNFEKMRADRKRRISPETFQEWEEFILESSACPEEKVAV